VGTQLKNKCLHHHRWTHTLIYQYRYNKSQQFAWVFKLVYLKIPKIRVWINSIFKNKNRDKSAWRITLYNIMFYTHYLHYYYYIRRRAVVMCGGICRLVLHVCVRWTVYNIAYDDILYYIISYTYTYHLNIGTTTCVSNK